MNLLPSLRTFTGLCVSIGLATCVPADEQPDRDSRTGASSKAAETHKKLDLNTASFEALAAVPVIGKEGAQAIIAARPYARIDDLNRLSGISAERLEQIRANVQVAPARIPEQVVKEKLDTRQPSAKRQDREKRVERIDLNTADLQTLASTPGIGPELARAIVDARPYATIDDLSRLSGLSAERLEQIRRHVTVAGSGAVPDQPAPRQRQRAAP